MARSGPTILAFDTSAAHCAAALLMDGRIVAERHEEMKKGQAERLFPMLDETLASGGLTYADLDAIAVGVGPGNFTGIRIAVSGARGLSVALGIPAIGVSSFEIMAFRAPEGDMLVALEAPRDQAYVQLFHEGKPTGSPRLIDPASPPSDLGISAATLILGQSAEQIADRFGAGFRETRPESPAHDVAHIAAVKAHTRPGMPTPLYVRPPDAAPASDPPPVILP
ncbi:MAG: tRNA (adenosine(37)-N6)-threonylcarbamoyltransferase complex dimerization subunit type 1 TsaB [Silicimonas sp.]|nr:tRNA (adenosine(37)-N6)-threonylcarbamoyltransferase complex dimerization subunit type 1 TsaB [Silicimonas sp.]